MEHQPATRNAGPELPQPQAITAAETFAKESERRVKAAYNRVREAFERATQP